MQKILISSSLIAMITACSPSKVVPTASGDGTSVTSSISGDQKDIKELNDNFKGFQAKLSCDDKTWDSTNVALAEKSLDISFKTKDNLSGKTCQVELRGDAMAGKKVNWTSPDSSTGLLYMSTRDTVSSTGVLKVNFYKTFIVTDSNKTYRPLLVHANFTAKYLMAGADKAVLKSVNLACKDRADVAAKLDKEIVFTKDTKEAKADISFPQVEVGKASDCVFRALFDERTELSTDAVTLSIEAGDKAQEVTADFKNVVTLQSVKVDGSLNNQQLKDVVTSKDLVVTSAKLLRYVAGTNKFNSYLISYSLQGTRDGKCDVIAEVQDDKSSEPFMKNISYLLKAQKEVNEEFHSSWDDVGSSNYTLVLSSRCALESEWTILKKVTVTDTKTPIAP